MSVYDPVKVGPIYLVPGYIASDSVALDIVSNHSKSDMIYIQDGVINIPIVIWEQMQKGNT